MVDWGVVCLLAANCGSIVRYAGYGRRYLRRGTAAIADQPSLPRLYSATGTALRRSYVALYQILGFTFFTFYQVGTVSP